MKDFIKKIVVFMTSFIKKELKREKSLFFWIPFLLLFVLFLIIFIIYRVNIIGWLLTFILFIFGFIFRIKIFIYLFKIQIIIGIGFLIILSIIFIFTKGTSSNLSNNVSKTPLEELSYSKEYFLPDDEGSYKINLLTNKEENRYELELYFNANTSIIPSNFIWDVTKAESYMREHIKIDKTDQLEVFITSDDKKIDYYSHGPVSINVDYGIETAQIKGMFPTKFTIYFYNKENFKKFMNTYTNLEVYRYNIGEVGINNFKSEKNEIGGYMGSYGYNAEKAYKLHPMILEVDINWEDLKADLGL